MSVWHRLPAGSFAVVSKFSAAMLLGMACISFAPQTDAATASKSDAVEKKPSNAAIKRGTAVAENRSGKGWSIDAIPKWVIAPPDDGVPAAPSTSAQRREELVDIQAHFGLTKPQFFFRTRSIVSDTSALGAVTQWQMSFNPAYQRIIVHTATVSRAGVKHDKLKEAQLELMRREQGLEKSMITGVETLLMLLTDVRVGDAVEVAYTVEGTNPIFENKIDGVWPMASSSPVSTLHWRLLAPADKALQIKSISGDFSPEKRILGNLQELRIVRRTVEPVLEEKDTPVWVKIYPVLLVSEYQSWSEVAEWGERVFQPQAASNTLLDQKIEEFRASGLTGPALVSSVLHFVQNDIQYFSVSLGLSSHRPKPATRTLADRSGDCKDKVVLLNALLGRLGFDVKPALVSTYRNKGLAQFLPGTSEFDHVITRLVLDGKDVYLDPTLTGQGRILEKRGQPSWGMALIAANGGGLESIAEPPPAVNRMEFIQNWDLSQPGAPAVLNVTTRVTGLLAEAYRRGLVNSGLTKVAETLTNAYPRAYTGLKTDGLPEVIDDVDANSFEVRQRFVIKDFGDYSNGLLSYELGSVELLEALVGPSEPRRKYPYMLGFVQQLESSINLIAPRVLTTKAPAPLEINDKHFRLTTRAQINGAQISFQRNYERRSQEVTAGDLDAYRQQVLRARNQLSSRMRLPIIDPDLIVKDFERLDRLSRKLVGNRNDSLYRLVIREQATQVRDTQVLLATMQPSALASTVLISRGQSHNHLGEFSDALKDANDALTQTPESDSARDVRAVALVGLGRLAEALAEFGRIEGFEARRDARYWMGSVLVHQGQYNEAEKYLRQALNDSGSDDQRDFLLLWLYLAAEGSRKEGLQAIAPYVEAADEKKLAGALLRFFSNKLDRNAVMRVAEENADMRRLNLAEANFYLGQQAYLQGNASKAKSYMKEVLDTQALPYREYTFATLALQKP